MLLKQGCFDLHSHAVPERLGLTPHVWRRLSAVVLLILAGALPYLVMADGGDTADWSKLFLVIATPLLMYTLARPETIAVWRRLATVPFLANRWNWFQLCVCTFALVGVIEAICITCYGRFPLLPNALGITLNSLLLLFLIGVVFAVTNRFLFSVALIYSAYVVAFLANVIKVQYLHTTIRPLDVHYLTAFGEFSTFFFGRVLIAAAIVLCLLGAVAAAALWWKARYRAALSTRVLLAVVSCAGILGITYCDKQPTIARFYRSIDFRKNMSHGIRSSTQRGFLFEFVSDIPDSIPRPPSNYTSSNVARAVKERFGPSAAPAVADKATPLPQDDHVNVVFYLVESFMDPLDLNIKFTSDPIPAFRAAASEQTGGRVIVSKKFCGSTNTEFEVLTGMSCSFLPRGSCPYVQYVKRDAPCLSNYFQQRGYATFTAHAGPPVLYDRVRVYQHFRVGEAIWLTERTKASVGLPSDIMTMCPIDVDMAGRFPTDDSLVDTVIDVSKKNPRYFMYASANATHSPYNYEGYLGSNLDVCDPMSQDAKNELKTYINALRTSDLAIEKMLNYFRTVPEKTIVVIIGDHWPPFSNSAEIYAASGCLAESDRETIPLARRVPLLIWTNFDSKRPDVVCSANFLATEVLARIGMKPSGFLALNDAIRPRLPVLSNDCMQTSDGEAMTWDAAPPELKRLLEDYRLLQYDMLLGEQYSLLGL